MDTKLEFFEIFNELKNEFDRNPSLEEFFTLIVQSFNSIDEASNVTSIKLEFEGRIEIINKESIEKYSDLYGLNDNVYVLINGFLSFLFDELKGKSTEKKLVDKVLKNIVKIIAQVKDVHFQNDTKANLLVAESILAQGKGKKKRLKSGDVIAVPLPESKDFALVVFIVKNSFGLAFGIFNKLFKSLPKKNIGSVDVLKHPRYSDDILIQEGRWTILFNDEELLKLFPESPELFHSPLDDSSNGPFGVAETVEGDLRNLDAKESEELNIMSDDFVQTYTAKQLEYFIKKKIG